MAAYVLKFSYKDDAVDDNSVKSHLYILWVQGYGLRSIFHSTAIRFHAYVCKSSVRMVNSAQGITVDGFAILLDGQQIVLLCGPRSEGSFKAMAQQTA